MIAVEWMHHVHLFSTRLSLLSFLYAIFTCFCMCAVFHSDFASELLCKHSTKIAKAYSCMKWGRGVSKKHFFLPKYQTNMGSALRECKLLIKGFGDFDFSFKVSVRQKSILRRV